MVLRVRMRVRQRVRQLVRRQRPAYTAHVLRSRLSPLRYAPDLSRVTARGSTFGGQRGAGATP